MIVDSRPYRPSSSARAWASATTDCALPESIGPTVTEPASDPTDTTRNTKTAQPRRTDRPSEFPTITEAAARNDVSRGYIRHLIIDGSLPAVRSGRRIIRVLRLALSTRTPTRAVSMIARLVAVGTSPSRFRQSMTKQP